MRHSLSVGHFVALAVALSPATVASAGNIVGKVSSKSATAGKADDVAVWVHAIQPARGPSQKATLHQQGLQFSPALMVITAGQTVAMPNEDEVAHNAFSQSEARPFNLGIYAQGQSKDVTFPEPGVVDVQCSMHRRMHATIIVSPSSYHTLAKSGARYEIKNVPAGSYELRGWSQELGEFKGRVVVPENGAVDVDVVLTSDGGRLP
jgi:plastocyanin